MVISNFFISSSSSNQTSSHDFASKDQLPKFGIVMTEFANRVLSRHITSSNVLVVAPDAIVAAKNVVQNKFAVTEYSVGTNFLLRGFHEGHIIHAIDTTRGKHPMYWTRKHHSTKTTTLDKWWNSFRQNNTISDKVERWWTPSTMNEQPS